MKSLIRWTAILNLVSIAGFESLLLPAQQAQALHANTGLISQTTAQDFIKQAFSRGQAGDWQGMLDHANRAIQLNRGAVPAYRLRAVAYSSLGDYQQALVAANQMVQLAPQSALAYVTRGNAYVNLGDFQQALTDANKAVQLNPKFIWAYLVRASIHLHMGDLQPALADASQMIQLNPKFSPAYSFRGNARLFLVDFKGALKDANKALQLDPQNIAGYETRAQAYIGLGDFQKALTSTNQVIKLAPKSQGGYFNRARSHIGLGDFKSALNDANRAVQINSKSSSTYAVRARARIGLGDTKGGLTDAKQAIQLNPKDGDGYYARGLARLKQGDQQGATADYNQAIQKEPSLAKELENYTQTAQNQVPETKIATASPSPKPAQPPQIAQDVYAVASQITVLIEGQNPGSGVILAKTNNTYYVLTAKHVVATPDEYNIIVAGGKAYDVDTNKMKRLSNLDLAVIEFTSNQNYPVARVGNSDQVKQGANIYVSGWPLPDQAISKPTQIVTEGRVVGLQADDKDGYGFLYGNNTAPGMSGGPVLDAKGQVVGIHGRAAGNQTSGKVGINLGIPINLFLQSANQAGINLQQMGLKAQN